MTDIKNVTITISAAKALIAGAGFGAVMLAGFWTFSNVLIGDIREDVSFIRSDVTRSQDKDSQIINDAHEVETDLRDELSALTAELSKTVAALNNLGTTVAGLDSSISAIDDRLAGSISRQVNFETWVVAQLGGPNESTPTKIPMDWQMNQAEVFKAIFEGTDPLDGWYSMTRAK